MTTLKTVSMFLRAAKTDAEEAGESTEGMANSISELREEVLALTGGAVDIQLDEDTFKSTYQILKELSEFWHNLTDISQANLLELLGAKRNSNVVAALLENFSVAEEALATSVDSAGSALAENEKYLDSINGKVSIFKATFEELSNNFIDSAFVKTVVDIGTGLLNVLNIVAEVLNALGGLKTILIALVPYFAIFKTEALMSGFTLLKKPITLLMDKLAALPTLSEALGSSIMIMLQHMRNGATGTQALSKALEALGISAKGLQFTIVALGVAIAALVIDELVLTTEEANKKLEESKSEYQSITDELKSLNDELDTTNDRLSELQNKGTLTFTEQEELQRLQKTNDELERSISLKEREQAVAQSKKTTDFINQYSAFRNTPTLQWDRSNSWFGLYTDEKMLNTAVSGYKTSLETYNSNPELFGGALTRANEYKQQIEAYIQSAITAIEGIEYIDGAVSDEAKKSNEALDYYNDIIDKYSILLGYAGSKESSLDRLTTHTFAEEVSGLVNDNEVTVEELQADKYDEFIDKCVELGIISDDSTQSLAFLASYFNTTGEAAKNAADKISQVSDTVSTLNGIHSLADGLEQLDKIYADIYNKEDFDWGSILNNKEFTETFSGLGQVYTDFITTIANSPNDLNACQAAFNNLTTAYLNNSEELKNVTAETRNATIALLSQHGVVNATAIVDKQLAVNKEKARLASEGLTVATAEEAVAMLEAGAASDEERIALEQILIEKIRLNQTVINTSGDIQNLIAMAEAAGATTASIANLIKAKELLAQAEAFEAGGFNVLGVSADSKLGQIYLNSLRDEAEKLKNQPIDFKPSYNVSYGGGSATNKAKEQAAKTQKTWFDKQLAEHKHRVAMEQETDAEYFKWLESAYKKAYNEGIIQLEDYYKYEEEVYNSRKELFKDHLKDREHEISLLEEYGSQSEKIVNIYHNLINDVEKELTDARARGLTENDDYIQELEKQWQSYYDAVFDMFKDHLNDVEHEISMRENYDGESARIIKLYEGLKLDVEKEIADLRARGYTDEDEKIQYLQTQWQNYDKEIRDIRKDATEEAKDAINDLVEYRVDMLKQEVSDEKDALNEKLDNLKDFYDKQKEMLQDQYDEEKYLEEQAEKRKSVSDIESELAMLEFDDSAWAQKRKLELREELVNAQKDLNDFEDDHALDLTLDAIDKASEAQTKQIEAQMDALDKRLNDPQALYNQALIEIVSGTHDIYREMQEYNNKHGTGNPEDIGKKYEDAYKALKEYEDVYGKPFQGIQLNNSTNYLPENGSWDSSSISGTNPANKTPVSSIVPPSTPPSQLPTSNPPTSVVPAISKGSLVTVKTTATHFGSKSGGVKMASHVPGGTYTVMDINGDQVLIGRNGVATGWVNKSDLNINNSDSQTGSSTAQSPPLTKGSTVTIETTATNFGSKSGGVKMASHVPGGTYTVMSVSDDQILIGRNGVATGWVRKSDIVGYAKGTAYAKSGLARIFEEGYEQIFTSVDGNKYKLFNTGDKVLNAKATEFLYDFAESGGAIFNKILTQSLFGSLSHLNNNAKLMDIHMGDIVVQGNADNKTVSEIRRVQRENIDYILTEFSKLNK